MKRYTPYAVEVLPRQRSLECAVGFGPGSDGFSIRAFFARVLHLMGQATRLRPPEILAKQANSTTRNITFVATECRAIDSEPRDDKIIT